jgi:hypothetical protein
MKAIKIIAAWISTVMGAIIILSSVFYSGYSLLIKRTIDKERKTQSDLIQVERVNKWISQDSLINIKFGNISDTLKLVIVKQNQLIKQNTKLDLGFTKHLKLSEKVDELINFYELK